MERMEEPIGVAGRLPVVGLADRFAGISERVGRLQPAHRYLRIDLRCAELGVLQHRLDIADIGAVL